MKRELTSQSKMEQKNLPSLQLDKFQVGRTLRRGMFRPNKQMGAERTAHDLE